MKATVSIANLPKPFYLTKVQLQEGKLYLSNISSNKDSIYFIQDGVLMFVNSDLTKGIGSAWRPDKEHSGEFYEAPEGTSFTITQ